MSVQEFTDGLAVNLGQILSEIKFLAEEGLGHDGKVDRIDEL